MGRSTKFGHMSQKRKKDCANRLRKAQIARRLLLQHQRNLTQPSNNHQCTIGGVGILPGPSSATTTSFQDFAHFETVSPRTTNSSVVPGEAVCADYCKVEIKEEIEENNDMNDGEGYDFGTGNDSTLFGSGSNDAENNHVETPGVTRLTSLLPISIFVGRARFNEGSSRVCLLCSKKTGLNTYVSDSDGLNADFMVMFVLKKMLEMPRENLQQYLQLGHPRNWISFCGPCKRVVLRAVETQKNIEALDARLRNFQQCMKRRIEVSFNTTKEKVTPKKTLSLSNVTSDTRRYVATGNCDSYDMGVSSSSVESPLPSSSFQGSTGYSHAPYNDDVEDDTADITDIADTADKCQVKPIGKTECSKEPAAFRRCALCPKILPMDSHTFVKHTLYHYDRPYECVDCGSYLTGKQLELDNYPSGVRRNPETDPSHSCSLASLVKVEYKVNNIWGCAYCRQTFDTMEERNLHEQTVHRHLDSVQLSCECSCCCKRFRSMAEWRVHRVLEHPELAKFACYHCDEIFKMKSKDGFEFVDTKKMQTHIMDIHGPKFYKSRCAAECDFCGAQLPNEGLLKQHVDKQHTVDSTSSIKLFSCPVCFVRWKSRKHMQPHLLDHCGIDTRKLRRLKRYRKWICDVCGYETVVPLKFVEHKFMVHSILPEDKKKPILKCSKDGCSYECIIKNTLEIHLMKEHGKEREFKCDVCGKGFMKTHQLQRHQQIHKNAAVKPFQCDICGNSFAVRNYLYIHMRLSHQNRPFASTHKKRPTKRRKELKPTALQSCKPPPSSSVPPAIQVAPLQGESTLPANEGMSIEDGSSSRFSSFSVGRDVL